MLAYLGKDRQDAILAGIIEPDYQFKTELIGTENAKIINNLTVDIIEHSYGKDYIMLSDKAYLNWLLHSNIFATFRLRQTTQT